LIVQDIFIIDEKSYPTYISIVFEDPS